MKEVKWIWVRGDGWRCSNCDASPADETFNGDLLDLESNTYCWKCGSRMTANWDITKVKVLVKKNEDDPWVEQEVMYRNDGTVWCKVDGGFQEIQVWDERREAE